MAKRAPKLWVKLWESWFTTPSHASLDFATLHGGIGILMLANRGDDDGSGGRWLQNPDGSPMSIADIARSLRCRKSVANRIVECLENVGTLHGRCTGKGKVLQQWIGFPAFDKWQESPSAARMRKLRGVEERHSDAHSDATSDALVTREVEAEVEVELNPPNPPRGNAKKSNETPSVSDARLAQVLEIINERRSGVGLGAQKPTPKNKAAMLKIDKGESATLEDWQKVCRIFAAEVRKYDQGAGMGAEGTDPRPYFTLQSLARGDNFSRKVNAKDAGAPVPRIELAPEPPAPDIPIWERPLPDNMGPCETRVYREHVAEKKLEHEQSLMPMGDALPF